MRIELYVRHSEAFANKDGIFSGQSHQSNLTGPGIDLAWGLAESLKRNQISSTAIQASPIRRARQTAQIISWSLRLPVIYDPLLMEINQGVWEGQPSHWVKENYPDELALWIHSPAQFSIPGGETLAQVADRVDQFRRNLHQRVPEGAVLIVTHQVWLQVMVAKICGLDLNHIWEVQMANCAMTIVEHDEQRPAVPDRLLAFNLQPGQLNWPTTIDLDRLQ